jgi:magnesium transporter
MFSAYAFLEGNETCPLATFDDLVQVWARPEVSVWVDLEEPTQSDVDRLGEFFELDREALQDCLYGEQRPRIDEFGHYIFVVMYGLYGLKEQIEIDPHKLSAFCGRRFLVTVHRTPILSVRQVWARCGRHPEIVVRHGLDSALYTIIDLMIDYYLQIADRYEERLEQLEDQSFTLDVDDTLLLKLADVRRDLLELRRLANAQRQLLLPLAKGEFDFVSETLSQRFAHVRDHLSEVIDTVDAMRETLLSIRDNYHAALTRRTNDIVKILTIYAGIMLPLTLIAGIYGMNVPLWPNQRNPWSFAFVLALMLATAGALLAYFRRKKWLKRHAL